MQLKILKGNCLTKKTVFYLSDSLMIGSGRECDLRFEKTDAEPRHARIVRQNGKIYIEDLGAGNGVAVGGMLIQERNPLRSGDMVSLGRVSFQVKY